MEYRRALALSPENVSLKRCIERVLRTREERAEKEARFENLIWREFRQHVAANWVPPKHRGCLVTRCRVLPLGPGKVDVEIIGTSGSIAHELSAVPFVNSAPIFRKIPIELTKNHLFLA